MENKDDEALPCGSMPRYRGNHFISEELHLQEQQQTDDAKNNGFFNFIPNLPLNFLFGRFSNVIPEESEDGDKKNSPGNKISISDEVQKLGLTAEIKTVNDKKFEPYWIEIQPKVRKGHFRHKSATHMHTEKNTKNISSVDDNSFVEGVSKQPSDLDVTFKENLSKATQIIIDRDGTDFSGINYIPEKNATSTALENKDSVICRRGELFRRNSQDEITADLTRLRLGRIFRAKTGTGMKRSSSAECLRKIQTDMKIFDTTNTRKENSLIESNTDVVLKDTNTSLRRTSSTGNLQRLQNINALESTLDLETSSNTDGIIAERNSEGMRKRSNSDLSEKSSSSLFAYPESEDESSASPMSGKIKSLGTQSVKWATTSKVRQTKRERNMFSPTSF